MPGALKRSWTSLGTKVRSPFIDEADPKALLEQAILDAQDAHRKAVERAAAVFADQESAVASLERAMSELEKLHRHTTQATALADDARARDDATKAAEFTAAAESFAGRLGAVEREVEGLKELALQAARASDDAKNEVQDEVDQQRGKVTARNELLVPVEQAAMRGRVADTMAMLSAGARQDVPSFDELRDQIAAWSARAQGSS
jgi:phage shock protein A